MQLENVPLRKALHTCPSPGEASVLGRGVVTKNHAHITLYKTRTLVAVAAVARPWLVCTVSLPAGMHVESRHPTPNKSGYLLGIVPGGRPHFGGYNAVSFAHTTPAQYPDYPFLKP